MTVIDRIKRVIGGLVMIVFSLSYALYPKESLPAVSFLLSLGLLFTGIRMIFFYLTLARHMTGGLNILFRGMLLLDLGLFSVKLPELPLMYVMFYLAGINAFSGIATVLQVRDAVRLGSPSWRLKLLFGILNIVTALLCILFLNSASLAVLTYSIGVFNSGVILIIQAFRKTASIYIQ